LWQFVYKYSINGSDAAKQDLLQDTGNDSIAGVPVVFGTPKGVNASSSLGDARLLVYLHGGGESAACLASALCIVILGQCHNSCIVHRGNAN
jgi:hypothetical protein